LEHHLDVIKTADKLIDLAPEGGRAGGEAVSGTYTGRFLKAHLQA